MYQNEGIHVAEAKISKETFPMEEEEGVENYLTVSVIFQKCRKRIYFSGTQTRLVILKLFLSRPLVAFNNQLA